MNFTERFKRKISALVMVVGLITEAKQAEDILRENKADLIGMSRELMYHGDWPIHAAKTLGVDNYFACSQNHMLLGFESAKPTNNS